MQLKKIFTGLLLCVAIGLPQYASAARYCPVTDDGKIRLDECKYSSNEECKQASESKKDCVADMLDPSDKAPYCLIRGWQEICDKYYEYEPCEQDALKQAAHCTPNPRYKGADK